MSCAYLNGDFPALEEARIAPLDQGFQAFKQALIPGRIA